MNLTSMTKIDVVLCVQNFIFKSVQVCGGCCKMFRGLTFLGTQCRGAMGRSSVACAAADFVFFHKLVERRDKSVTRV